MDALKTFHPGEKLTVTKVAQDHLRQQVQKDSHIGVELNLIPNGCAGFEYDWELVSEYYSNQYAYVLECDGFVLLVNELSLPLLEGSLIDIKDEGIKGSSLIVTSPKAVGSCGCGESVTFDV
jgi:iron-sulfur cluster assembly accessory protein